MRTQASTAPPATILHPQRLVLAALNVVGGIAVLGSYAYELAAHAGAADALWGAVPSGLQPFYTGSMLLAAAGYFPLTLYFLLRVDPDRARVAGYGYGAVNILYALILAPSALWMPLTFAMIERPDAMLWLTIRIVLALVALGSLGLLAALLTLRPRAPGIAHRLAVTGGVAFCVQTVLLDAIVWPAYFPPA